MTKKLIGLMIIGAFLVLPAGAFADQEEHDSDPDGNSPAMEEEGLNSSTFQHPQIFNKHLKPIVTAIDYHTRSIYLFNSKTDQIVTFHPHTEASGWPGDLPLQHTVLMANAKRLYVTTDNTPEHSAYLIGLRIKDIDWKRGTAKLKVEVVREFDDPDTPAELPFVQEVEGSTQATPGWLNAAGTQMHGPTVLPYSNFIYFTTWTSDKVRVWNVKSKKFAEIDPIVIPGHTEQTHGVTFNASGTLALGTGYFFDNNVIDTYKVNRRTGSLSPAHQIMLGNEDEYAAFSHYTSWLNERFAVTATMQFDRTSLTPLSSSIIGPSVWLIDAWEGTAEKIIANTEDPDGEGIYLSASDLVVVGNKLYVAEENTIRTPLFQRGSISVFDVSDASHPQFLKRFRPGHGLPDDFRVAHSITPTLDNRYLLVASWASGYVVKIDTLDDTIVRVFGPEDGLTMPHGFFGAGNIR